MIYEIYDYDLSSVMILQIEDSSGSGRSWDANVCFGDSGDLSTCEGENYSSDSIERIDDFLYDLFGDKPKVEFILSFIDNMPLNSFIVNVLPRMKNLINIYASVDGMPDELVLMFELFIEQILEEEAH